jgi:SAM-dependent methyltransferase
MRLDVEAVDSGDWAELAAVLHRAGYTTEGFRAAAGVRDPVEEILKNTGRYSYFYLDQLAALDSSFAVLARLFMLCGRVPAADLVRLGDDVRVLQRTGLVVPVAQEPALVHATAAVTEVRGRLFLSDSLFENTGDGFVVHDTTGRCMPPHASSLELLGRLHAPGATSFLDVGCGSGCQSVLFAAGYERVVGFDQGARQVSFARANARLNGVEASYVVDRWETFPPAEPFDHVAFNTPNAETAFGFINGSLDKVLAPAGVAQVYLVAELADGAGGWAEHVAGRLARPGDWDVRTHVHSGSPFGLPARYLAEGRLPAGTLLVDHPSKARDYLAGLRRRRVAEVASLTLTLTRPGPRQM